MRYLRTVRDILDYAIQQEDQANHFYTRLSQEVEKDELREALKNFAVDEFQHKLRLEGVKDGQVQLTSEEVGTLNLAETIKGVKPTRNMSYKDLLALAIKKEAEAEQLYTKLTQLTKRKEVRELFTLLAQEEAQHKLHLEIEYDLTTF